MEKNIDEKKKKRNIIIGILILIIALLATICLYVISTKSDKKEETKQGNDNTITETDDYQEYDMTKAYDLLLKIGYDNKDYYDNIKTIKIKDIPMSYKVAMAINAVEREDYDNVSEDDVKKTYEAMFNDSYTSVNEAVGGCEKWKKSNDGYYRFDGGGCGSGSISNDALDTIVSSFIRKGNVQIIAFVAIFDLYEKHELRDYTTDRLILKDSSINENLEYAEELEKFNLLQYANEFQQYKFTFVFKNGNYALDSIEPIND